ncbi:MAG: DUF6438 domain-containing protein [Hyphomonadaceae bacterium]
MSRSILAALCCAVTLAACVSAPAPQPTATPAASITLFEGGCYYMGSCTTYEMTVQADGTYRLDGQSMTRTEGISEGQLDADAFAAADDALSAADFASLPAAMNGSDRDVWDPDVYPCMNHAPGVRITRRSADGSERTVYWDQGCRSAQMSALLDNLRTAFRYDDLVRPAQ